MKLSGYKEAGEQYEGFLIDNGIQEQVIREFGFDKVLPAEEYRAQCLKLKEVDEEIKNACVWLQFDTMRSGELRVSLLCRGQASHLCLYRLAISLSIVGCSRSMENLQS